MRKLVLVAIAAIAVLTVTGCEAESLSSEQAAVSKNQAFDFYVPKNNVEQANYNAKYALDDDPATVLWCTGAFPGFAGKLVTFPIKGKLTSSSVRAFRDEHYTSDGYAIENPAPDGMYHGSPPPYRYGFTPAGVYVEFTDIATVCTTQPTDWATTNSIVVLNATTTLDGNGDVAELADLDKRAEADPKDSAAIFNGARR